MKKALAFFLSTLLPLLFCVAGSSAAADHSPGRGYSVERISTGSETSRSSCEAVAFIDQPNWFYDLTPHKHYDPLAAEEDDEVDNDHEESAASYQTFSCHSAHLRSLHDSHFRSIAAETIAASKIPLYLSIRVIRI